MTSIQQREQLQSQIWKIANEVRGAVDGWDFKQFVLGTLFYRFISENFTDYIEGGDESIDYASLPDSIITPEIKEDAIKTKGYFIYPSQLFANVVKTAYTNPNLNTDLKAIFDSIESSANGYASEKKTLSKILCKWKQDSVVSFFLYLDSVFKYKHKLVHNQAPV